MYVDGSHWCDWCGVQLVSGAPGRLVGIGQDKPSVPLLVGDRVCGDCDAAVKRGSSTYQIKPNKSVAKYVRDIEAGRKKAPCTGRVQLQTAFGKTDITVPVKLKADGSLRPEDRKLLKAGKS